MCWIKKDSTIISINNIILVGLMPADKIISKSEWSTFFNFTWLSQPQDKENLFPRSKASLRSERLELMRSCSKNFAQQTFFFFRSIAQYLEHKRKRIPQGIAAGWTVNNVTRLYLVPSKKTCRSLSQFLWRKNHCWRCISEKWARTKETTPEI